MAMDAYSTARGVFTEDTGKMGSAMEKAATLGRMESIMLESGTTTRCTELESL